ncbi:MAG: tandem-95 repeat protein [Caldilineaceae bacterium]|nr:tandem-95 repeat protein [Caldilineaceae bacterium]
MKNRWFTLAMGLLLMIGLSIVALGAVNWRGQRGAPASSVILAQPAQSQPAESGAAQIAGNYSGAVKLDVTVGGVFSNTLATPPPPGAGTPTPPDLGSIDLSLQLTQTGNALSGYVSLDKTLVYSVEHTLGTGANSIKIGPYVNGGFDGTNLTLQSEKVTLVVSGRTVQRQFRLTGTSTASDGGQVSGEYRETLWGYASVPVTVIGSFTLQRPGFGSNVPLPSNQAPTVVADTATTTQGVAVTINVLANDSDPDGDALTITSVSKPQFGAATTNGQTVTYTPNANFVGNDTFSYVVSDGKGGAATGSVTITVTGPGGPNRAPTAANDTATTPAGVAVTIDVLANDSDPDGDALTITIDGPPSHGAATVNNGKVVYTPQAGFTGTDRFTYIVSDGKGGTASATVTITVTGSGNPNRAPSAANDSATTTAGVAVTIDVLANDSDPDGDGLTIASVTPPANGTAVVDNGRVVYTPNASFVGSDSFTYTITDGKGGSATATVTITVTDQPGGGDNSLYLPLIQR